MQPGALRRLVAVIPVELDYFDQISRLLEASGFEVRRAGDDATLARQIADADVALVYVTLPIKRHHIAVASRLRGVVSLVAGVDMIDRAACDENGLLIANGPVPENSISTAEATIALVMALITGLKMKETALRAGDWRPPGGTVSNLLWHKTVGIVGVGRIGRAVAARLQGWDVNLLGYGPRLTPETAPPGMTVVDLRTLLRESDIVSLHAGLNEQTRGMIGPDELALMKPTAYLVNTARGALVDELALADALRAGRLAGAAIDVWREEPVPPDHPLLSAPPDRVILTGHCLAHSGELVPAMMEAAIENIGCMVRGELPRYVVNPEVIPAWRTRLAALDGSQARVIGG